MESYLYIGEVFALTAPLCWAVAVILFRKTGEHVPPLALNLFKNVLAIAMFSLTLLVQREPLVGNRSLDGIWLLLVSGGIGIAISDTLFFMCLNRVGAGLQAIVGTSYSPIIILLSVIFLGERLTVQQSLGALLIVGAVLAVSYVRDRRAQARVPERTRGIVYGLLAMLTQGVSIVMVKPLLEEIPMVWATWWRLMGGLVVVIFMALRTKEHRAELRLVLDPHIWPVMIPGAVMGTYVSLLLWMGGMKYAPASIAAVLNQTSTLWIFLLAVLVLKEPATKRRLVGLALGVVGVLLVSLG